MTSRCQILFGNHMSDAASDTRKADVRPDGDSRVGLSSLEHPELCARCHRPLLVERGRRELCQSELCRERRADLLHDQSRGWDDIAEDDDR